MSVSFSGHIDRGTEYGASGVKAYAKSHVCTDMAHFLNAHIIDSLASQHDKRVLDAGCGAGPWAIYAAKFARRVDAIDIQAPMIEEALEAIKKAGVADKVDAIVGDATDLPYNNNLFDHTISINVGCNLPPNLFDAHFKEVSRVLVPNGTADISAPDSLDTVFTDGSHEDEFFLDQIEKVLENVPSNPSPDLVQSQLNSLNGLTSATFVQKDERLELLTPLKKMDRGEKIWRKLTKVTLPNRYYSDADYLAAFQKTGLKVTKSIRTTLKSEKERQQFNYDGASPNLGKAYLSHSPFVVYQLQKQQSEN